MPFAAALNRADPMEFKINTVINNIRLNILKNTIAAKIEVNRHRHKSAMITRCFLEKLSPSGPIKGRRKIRTSMAGARTEDIAEAEPVLSKTHQAKAILLHESPSKEMSWPVRKFQKSFPHFPKEKFNNAFILSH
jgi:hypothetical protein